MSGPKIIIFLPDNTEEIDVSIVDSEVYEDNPSASLNPSMIK